MGNDGSVKIGVDLDQKGFESALSKMGGVASGALKGIGTAVGVVSTALATAGVAAFKLSTDFETALAKTSTMFGDVNVNTESLNEQVLELSDSTGIAADAIGESLYNALSAGIPATEDMGDAMDFMGKNAKLAKAGFTDIDTAVTATAKILNAYKMDVSETDKVHRILMQTQNNGITTVNELGAVLAGVTPTAAAMNVEFEQIGAALATMTAQGTPTAQAVTQLNSLFAELGKSGTVASEAIKEEMGKSFQELMKEGVPLNEVLGVMDKTAQANGKSLLDMFGSLEAGKAALAMSGENAATYTKNLNSMGTEADVVGIAYEKMAATTGESIIKMQNSIKNLGISVMQDSEGAIAEITAFAGDLGEQLTAAYGENGLEGLVVAIGDVMAQAVVKIAESAPEMVAAAVDLIQALVDGIVDNGPLIVDAAKEVVIAFADGLGDLVPIAKPVTELVKFLAENFDMVLNVVVPLTAAFVAYNTVLKAGMVIEQIGNLWKMGATAITALQTGAKLAAVAQAALTTAQNIGTGATVAATVAQTALNIVMAANPIMLAVIAVAALAAGIAIWVTNASKASVETVKLTNETNKITKASQALNDELKTSSDARKENNDSVKSAAKTTAKLTDSLFDLAKAEKKTTEEKALMKAKVDELNESIPGLALAMDEETGALSMQKDEILRVIEGNERLLETKEAQAAMTEITREQIEVEGQLKDLELQRIEIQRTLDENVEKSAKGKKELKEQLAGVVEQEAALSATQQQLTADLTTAEEVITANAKAQELQNQALGGAPPIVDAATAATQRLADGSRSLADVVTATGLSLGDVEAKFKTYADVACEMFQKIEDKSNTSVKQMTENIQANTKAMETWSDNLGVLAERGVDEGLVKALRDGGVDTANETQNLVNASDAELQKLNDVFKNGGAAAKEALLKEFGLLSDENVAGKMVDGMATEVTENKALDNAMISKVKGVKDTTTKQVKDSNFPETGKTINEDIAKGEKESKATEDQTKEVVKTAKEASKAEVSSSNFPAIGKSMSDGIAKGIRDGIPAVQAASRDMMNAANTQQKKTGEIHSPSKRSAREIGKPVAQGVAVGINQETNSVLSSVDDLNRAVFSRMHGTMALENAKFATAAKSPSSVSNTVVTNDNGVNVTVNMQTAPNTQNVRSLAQKIGKLTQQDLRSRGILAI